MTSCTTTTKISPNSELKKVKEGRKADAGRQTNSNETVSSPWLSVDLEACHSRLVSRGGESSPEYK
jgi:hypothetical protein